MSTGERRDSKTWQRRGRQERKLGLPEANSPWSVPIPLAEIPATGRRVELSANSSAREAVAKTAGVLALPRFEAVFELAPLSDHGVRVSGTVSATVEQSCVVTLEPMLNEINEQVDLILVQPDAAPPPRATLDIDVTQENDTPDVLHDRAVDLAALAIEFLILGIDPYPRKPGAHFEPPGAVNDPTDHPFAALAALKKDSGQKRQ